MTMPSIHSCLTRRLAWLVAAVWVPLSVLIVIAVVQEYGESFHSRTAHTAQLMLAFAATQPDLPTMFPTIKPEKSSAFDVDLDDYLVVISRNGQLLYASESLPAAELLVLPMTGRADVGGFPWILNGFEDESTGTRVIIGVDAFEPFASSLQVAGLVAIYVLVAMALVSIALTYGIRSGLKPLSLFARQVRERSETNLTPLAEAATPTELHGVAQALNGLMTRLQMALDRERDFVSNAAHELRTPLTAIRAQVEAIATEFSDRSSMRIGPILDATDRASRLIGQLLDIARSQSLDLTHHAARSTDLVALTQSTIAELVPLANDRAVEIALESPHSVIITAYPDLLVIVLRNLIENAIKYANSPGRVTVTIAPSDDPQPQIELRIEDDGPGLTIEAFAQAFERFQRLGRSGGDGIGLGLAIVAELCQRMALAIDRLPPGPLAGLSVRLCLPIKIG